jgi:hypothetical protein
VHNRSPAKLCKFSISTFSCTCTQLCSSPLSPSHPSNTFLKLAPMSSCNDLLHKCCSPMTSPP